MDKIVPPPARKRYSSALSARDGPRLEPLWGGGRRRTGPLLNLVTALLYGLNNGGMGRALPGHFPPWGPGSGSGSAGAYSTS